MIHNLILWVTALEFVILVTAKLFYSEFFHLEYLALRWNYCTNHLVVLLFLICLYMWQLLKSLFCSYELSFYCTFLSLLEFSINVRFYVQKPSVNNSVIFKHTRKAAVIFFSVFLNAWLYMENLSLSFLSFSQCPGLLRAATSLRVSVRQLLAANYQQVIGILNFILLLVRFRIENLQV